MAQSEETRDPLSVPSLPWMLPTDESTADLDTPDAFGHVRYVLALEELIETGARNQTIGLYGKYGSGKSWIVKQLGRRLAELGTTRVVEYNAWRFAEEEIRRDFLVRLDQEMRTNSLYLNEDQEEIKPDLFKVDLETTTEGPQTFSWAAARTAFRDTILFGVALIGLSAILGLAVGLRTMGWPDGLTFIASGAFGGLAWAGSTMQAMLNVNRLTVHNIQVSHRPRVEFAEEFLAMFEGIIVGKRPGRLVIVIDNIDRCSPETSMKVLSTIKNFLEPSAAGVIFLIPCDIQALERHLTAAFRVRGLDDSQANLDAKEYLGKFFSSAISITGFNELELRSLAATDVRQTKFGLDLSDAEVEGVCQIASATNHESPRTLKVFLNTVTSSSLVLNQSSGDGETELTPTDIAKLCALRDRAPDLWSQIERDSLVLVEAELSLTQATTIVDNAISGLSIKNDERQIIRAIQWHDVSPAKIQLFLGLRMPPDAEGIPRYFEYLQALEDADSETAFKIASQMEESVVSRLVKLSTDRVLAIRERQPARAVNPTLVGLNLLAQYNNLPTQIRSTFLYTISEPQILQAAVRRLGPGVTANICAKNIDVSHSSGLRRVLIQWLGEQDDPMEDDVVDAIDSITPICDNDDIILLQNIVHTGLSNNLNFEHRLRRLSPEVADRAISDSSIEVMLKSFSVPEDPTAPPDNSGSLEVLAHWKRRISLEVITEMLNRTERYLTARIEGEIPFDSADTQAMTDILSLAREVGHTPVDVFSSVLQRRAEQRQPDFYTVLAERASEIEPNVSGQARAEMVSFVRSLIVLGDVVDGLIPASEGLTLATQASQEYSASSLGEILPGVISALKNQITNELLDLSFQLSRSMDDWRQLNELAFNKASSDLGGFGQMRSRLAPKLLVGELSLLFDRSVNPLIEFLKQEGQFMAASENLVALADIWSADDSERIVEAGGSYLSNGDASFAGRSARLLQEAISRHNPPNAASAQERAVQALMDGPHTLDGPQELFDLQLNAIRIAAYDVRIDIRGMVRNALPEMQSDPGRLFSVGTELIRINPQQHSGELLQPALDYALRTDNDEWRERAVQFIGLLEPAQSDMAPIREGLVQLDSLTPLSGVVREYIHDEERDS